MDFSQVKSLTIPEGEVTKIEVGGATVWEKGDKSPLSAMVFETANIAANQVIVDCDTFASNLSVDKAYTIKFRKNSSETNIEVFVESIDLSDRHTTLVHNASDAEVFFESYGIDGSFYDPTYDIRRAMLIVSDGSSGFVSDASSQDITINRSTFENNANVANGDKFLFEISTEAGRIVKNGVNIWSSVSHISDNFAAYGVKFPQATDGELCAVTFEKPTGN